MSKNSSFEHGAYAGTRPERTPEFEAEEIEQSIPERFEKIVRFYPRRLAIKAQDRSLTYEALNEAANRIAHAIVEKHGQGSEPVALLFEHSIDIIAAIFGTLKAGKFYFALDPSFPPQRIARILEDSQAPLIVTNDRNLSLAQQLRNNSCEVLSTSTIDQSFCSDNPGVSVSPEAPVNIRYTSGSTGEPKGIVQGHQRALYDMMLGTAERKVGTEDRLTLFHSVAFGASTMHLFQSLLNGASLFLFNIKSEGIPRLIRWLDEEQITVCDFPPSVFRQLAALMDGQTPPRCLRLITLVGAPVTVGDFDLYRKRFGHGTLLEIALGSTEAGMICSAIVGRNFAFPKEGAPGGYPCRGKKVLLLDEHGREVSPGEVGEIAVKSRYLPLGYWRRPELNREKFLADPDGGDERLCLTGDLGRMMPDGFLIHLGRKDLQVKIRGHRVEPGEIEAALLEHDAIKEAVVVAQDDFRREKRLVAYVVACGKTDPDIHELRSFLHNKLPDYMVPSVFLPMKALPLTPNGKVDRRAFPDPGNSKPELDTPYVAPRTLVEKQLAGIWAEVLSLGPIGMDDNFFDLGGHSLAATRVVSQVIKNFQLEIPLQSIFQSPTIAAMAAVITEHRAKKLDDKELDRILAELDSLSDTEASRLLLEEAPDRE